MKKINNHGLTANEVIICFSITAVIVISLFKTINNYKDKQYMESNKNLVQTYKNTVTKTIQDDVLKNGGVYKIENENEYISGDYYQGLGDISVVFCFGGDTCPKKSTLEINYMTEGEEKSEDDEEEYILYTDVNNNKEKFPLSDIPGVIFNEPTINYDRDGGILSIYVGVTDIDLGDKYSVLDITLPIVEKWPTAYVKKE